MSDIDKHRDEAIQNLKTVVNEACKNELHYVGLFGPPCTEQRQAEFAESIAQIVTAFDALKIKLGRSLSDFDGSFAVV
jgi:hypothetical protein